MNYTTISSKKYFTLISVINDSKNYSFFNELDNLLTKKRFDNAYEHSINENILHASSNNLTCANIRKTINNFIKTKDLILIGDNRNLYELIKMGNLTSEKLEKAIDVNLHKKIVAALDNVSHETSYFSYDFLILRICDNFILKSTVSEVKQDYIKAKHNILKKLINFKYKKEIKENETTFLCWVDRILYAVMNKEICPEEFVLLCKKILNLSVKNIYFYWKILHSVNYTLLQQDFSANKDLRDFKKEIFQNIEDLYNSVDMKIEAIKALTVSTLAKKAPVKEDFYYLFDTIKLAAQKNEAYKLFCLKLCKYIINYNYEYNIFCYRFIRKYFIDSFFDMLKNPLNNVDILTEEVSALIALFHIDTYFCFNRTQIFSKIIEKLKAINDTAPKLTYKNFYQFCDVLDYIMSENTDILTPDIIQQLNVNPSERSKLSKCFNLLLRKYN